MRLRLTQTSEVQKEVADMLCVRKFMNAVAEILSPCLRILRKVKEGSSDLALPVEGSGDLIPN